MYFGYFGLPYGPLDEQARGELQSSWTTQLDTVGMQPHAREYLEKMVNCMRSEKQFETIDGQTIDYVDGIQFSGKP